jgi:hypothetical protein
MRRKNSWLVLLWCALPLLIVSWGTIAAPGKVRTTTYQGIPFDELITFRVRNVLLRVPAGYVWPIPKMRNIVNEQESFGFSFWMPDKRYLKVSPVSVIGGRPKEDGFSEPPSDAYVVTVGHLKPTVLSEPGYISPEKAFKNLTSISGRSSYSFKEEEFGLVRFWRHDWPHPRPEPFTNYRHLEGTDPLVQLQCTPPDQTPRFPGCSGTIHFVAEGFGFFISFSRDHVSEWRQIVFAVRDLFNSWKAHP